MSKLPLNSLKNAIKSKNINFYSRETVLNEENMKRTINNLVNYKPVKQLSHKSLRKAAILIPLCIYDDKVSLLYTLRAANLKSHRGQVSFPGGMKDHTDKNLQDTAFRETYEELGLEPTEFKLWGCGKELLGRNDTTILPVVAELKKEVIIEELKINVNEVEEVFAASLEDLCQPNMLRHTQFRNFHSLPVFDGSKHRIWGITAVLTNMFLSSLLPRDAYNHKIRFIPRKLG